MGESVANKRKPGRVANSKEEAIEKGLKTYYGSQCIKCGSKIRYASYNACASCRRITAKSRHKKRKKFLWSLKDKPCTDCKIQYHPVAMQFDHIRGRKSFELSVSTRYKIETTLKEISKCELVCANCHAVRTYNRATKKSYGKNSGKNTKRTRQSNKASS
jgi:hypothetical protein